MSLKSLLPAAAAIAVATLALTGCSMTTNVSGELKKDGVTTTMNATGYGESKPVAPNENADGSDNPAGRALNRRVEIFIPAF